jgi:hypothetical protein
VLESETFTGFTVTCTEDFFVESVTDVADTVAVHEAVREDEAGAV